MPATAARVDRRRGVIVLRRWRPKGDDDDFRRCVETHGQRGRADSAGNVEVVAVFGDVPVDVAQRRTAGNEERSPERYGDLPAMRVTGQRQRGPRRYVGKDGRIVRERHDSRLN